MKLNKVDRIILELFRKEKKELYLQEISRKIGKKPPQVKRNIDKLVNNNILKRGSGYPIYYKLEFPEKDYEHNFKLSKCPKCENIQIVDRLQQTLVCSTCKKRYFISKKSVKDSYWMMLFGPYTHKLHFDNSEESDTFSLIIFNTENKYIRKCQI